MNVLPNSFTINSSSNLITSAASVVMGTTNKPVSTATADNTNRPLTIIKCAVCEEFLLSTATNQNDKKGNSMSYRMLAVRPSIGSASKDAFFPILETLTHTSAVHVPCCLRCSDSLLEQWNDFETKNVAIKNRVYRLPATKNKQMQNSIGRTITMVIDPSHNHSSKSLANTKLVSSVTRILAHPISLSNKSNTNTNLILTTNSQNAVDCSTKSSSSNTTTPSPQDEVLDLSMSTGTTTTVATTAIVPIKNSSNVDSSSVSKTVELSGAVLPTTTATTTTATTLNLPTINKVVTVPTPQQPTTVLNVSGSRMSRNATASSSSSDIIAISPYSLNSSMTNLIKVSSNPVAALSLKAFQQQPMDNVGAQNNTSTSASLPKRPLLSCALCEDPCATVYSIMLRPMGNCPYFPSLTPYVKPNSIDSIGKINVCEYCHHQLILQWDTHQKNNKPVLERHYQLIKTKSPATTTETALFSTASNNSNSSNTSTKQNNSIVPPISQSFVSIVAANKTFLCIKCGKDLIAKASNNNNQSNSHLAFSIQVENDSIGNVITRQLNVQSAQEINLLPFIQSTTATTSSSFHQQLQLLQDNGRVLVCAICFESINSRSNNENSGTHSLTLSQTTEHKTNTIAPNRPPHDLNGKGNDDQSSVVGGNLLCLACNQHKSQYLVETKENNMKKPFFPFLHDPNEPNGKARLCAPCHLMLETQWDAFENSYVPYNQRSYRLPSSSSQSTLQLTKRPAPLPNSSPSSSSLGLNIISSSMQVNGQPPNSQPPPLKIQIVPTVNSNGSTILNSSDHLLLTTVNQQQTPQTNNQNSATISITDPKHEQRVFKLMSEFLANLGGPHPLMSGMCSICQQASPVGQTYQIFATSSNIFLSAELGILPYFPMLKHNNNSTGNKNSTKNSQENIYMACTYCYHSLIAQWSAYHLSNKPEDRDVNARHYNCRDFVCYVCGVTTYRQFVRSITVKNFPFLLEHKRPPGSLSMNKGESVITCLTCYQTLTHQWIENERMGVPLEMRKYNWMAVPPPPLPSSSNKTNDSEHKKHSNTSGTGERTVIPILTNTATLSYQLNTTNSINHNVPVTASSSTEMISKAIIVNTGVAGNYNNVSGSSSTLNSDSKASTGTNMVPPPLTSFNPSHTLAPLVAAAMAATPVTIKQEINQTNSDPIMTSHNNTNMPQTKQHQQNSTGNNSNNYSDVLRQLAASRQEPHSITIHKSNNQITLTPNHEPISNSNHSSRSPSILTAGLTTLASVAALAGNRNSTQFSSNQISSHSITSNSNKHHRSEHSELPKAVINSNSFAMHFNALSNNSKQNNNQISKTNSNNNNNNKKMDDRNGGLKKNINNNVNTQNLKRTAQIMELEECVKDSQNYDQSLSKVNIEVMKLRNKRIARLKKLKEMDLHDNDHSDLSDEELTGFDDNRSNTSSVDLMFNPDDSFVHFMSEVLPVLPLDEKDNSKMNFLSMLGLTTHRLKRQMEIDNFLKRKISRRLSKASFKVDFLQEIEDDILEADPQFELLKCYSYFSPSDINPNSVLLRKTDKLNRNIDKNSFIGVLGLVPTPVDKQLKTEIDWLSVLRNRQLRRKRRIVCVGKIFNNLSDEVFNNWIKELSSSTKHCEAELIKRFIEMIPLDEHGFDDKRQQNKEDENQNDIVNQNGVLETVVNNNKTINQHNQIISTVNHNNVSENKITENHFEQQKHGQNMVNNQQIVIASNHLQPTTTTAPIVPIVLNNTKIINTKQFAQEFHESVLLETVQKQMQKNNTNSTTIIGTVSGQHHQQNGLITTVNSHTNNNHLGATTNNNAHMIIYHHPNSDHHLLRQSNQPNQNVSIMDAGQIAQPTTNGLITTSTTTSAIIKVQDKGFVRDQILKLHHMINDLNRECQVLNDKKNEIIATMEKLENEKTLYQLEVDRLSKCLDL